jgi:hypothetical protein
MKRLLIVAAVSEAVAGLILLVNPPIVIRLLFNSEIDSAGVSMSRITGIGLISLGVACWPVRDTSRAFFGMSTYGLLAALYLAYLGFNGRVGFLLWPAVAIHTALSILLVLAWLKERGLTASNT